MKKDIKILIADDSMFMRGVLRDILEGAGFLNFLECGDGKTCLDEYNREKPDLVLLDIIMPEVDGIEVLKKIGHEAKIVVISSVGQQKVIEEAQKLGSRGYIVKPFERKQVLQEIEKALG